MTHHFTYPRVVAVACRAHAVRPPAVPAAARPVRPTTTRRSPAVKS
jgi:hypothetical protein